MARREDRAPAARARAAAARGPAPRGPRRPARRARRAAGPPVAAARPLAGPPDPRRDRSCGSSASCAAGRPQHFSRLPGGGLSPLGIAWLAPLVGFYFGWRLAAGRRARPARGARVGSSRRPRSPWAPCVAASRREARLQPSWTANLALWAAASRALVAAVRSPPGRPSAARCWPTPTPPASRSRSSWRVADLEGLGHPLRRAAARASRPCRRSGGGSGPASCPRRRSGSPGRWPRARSSAPLGSLRRLARAPPPAIMPQPAAPQPVGEAVLVLRDPDVPRAAGRADRAAPRAAATSASC